MGIYVDLYNRYTLFFYKRLRWKVGARGFLNIPLFKITIEQGTYWIFT